MAKEKSAYKQKRYFDFVLLFIVLFLLGFGLVMVYSTSSYSAALDFEDSAFYLKRQIRAVLVGSVIMLAATFFPLKGVKKFSKFTFIVAIVSIFLILTPLGYEANGARRWIRIAGLSIQPAEICKMCVIIYTAALLDKMGDNVRKGWKGFWFPMVPTGIICALVLFLTDNLSSAIIIGLIPMVMIFIGEKKNKWPPVMFLLMIGVIFLVVILVTNGWIPASLSFRLERIMAWLDPEAHSEGKGMQILQSLYGIGSGGVWGKGLGKSMQKLGFLPEAQNDMIFSIICEELGVMGGLSVMAMFGLLLWRIRDISAHSRDYFGNLLVTGVFANIAIQVILNISVVTNTIPNTGISLPLISYGGSSVIILMAELGLVMNVGRQARFVEEFDDEQENSETD